MAKSVHLLLRDSCAAHIRIVRLSISPTYALERESYSSTTDDVHSQELSFDQMRIDSSYEGVSEIIRPGSTGFVFAYLSNRVGLRCMLCNIALVS